MAQFARGEGHESRSRRRPHDRLERAARSSVAREPDGRNSTYSGRQADLKAPPPRLPDGRIDISGLWTKASPRYSRNIAADLRPDKIQPWASKVVEQRKEDLRRTACRCAAALGPAYSTSGDCTGSEMMRVVQSPQLIVMLNPDLTYRQIWMDGRALEAEPIPSWMGYPSAAGGRYARRREQRLPQRNLARSGRPSPHGAAASD